MKDPRDDGKCSRYNNAKVSITNIGIRKANNEDFGRIVEMVVKSYTDIDLLSGHLKIDAEDVREMIESRLQSAIEEGICVVAEIDGKIEAMFAGILLKRFESEIPDYLQVSESVYAVEALWRILTEDVWTKRIPPKFNTVCQLIYCVETGKAHRFNVDVKLMHFVMERCSEIGVHVLMAKCLMDRTTKWMIKHGFVAVNSLPLERYTNEKGRPYFDRQVHQKAVLLLAFLEDTLTSTIKSKL